MDLGMDPAGMSLEYSCTRTFCQSTITDSFLCSSQVSLFSHFSFLHRAGSVYLNYCSTRSVDCPHTLQMNVPSISSGFESVVLVTVP